MAGAECRHNDRDKESRGSLKAPRGLVGGMGLGAKS